LAGRLSPGRDRAPARRRCQGVSHRSHRTRFRGLVRRFRAVRAPDRGTPAPRRTARLLRHGAFRRTRLGRLGAIARPHRAPGVTVSDEVDVLVVGFGPAGASAAIPAHDAGARVAVAEKTSAGGGNCVYSGGFLFDVDEPVALDHLDALCFGKTDRALLEAFDGGRHDVPGWL